MQQQYTSGTNRKLLMTWKNNLDINAHIHKLTESESTIHD